MNIDNIGMLSQREQDLLSDNLLSELNQIAQGNFGNSEDLKICEICERTERVSKNS
jgi:hypothetical protein